MRMSRVTISTCVLVLACVALVPMHATQTAPAGGRGQRGGGGRADAPVIGEGTLIAGAWGKDPVPLDPRGWGWMAKSYVSANFKRPFYNKAKEMLFSEKQVTSFTISAFDPEFYCEVRKHYGFVWFEMQHSTMSWDNI